MNKALFPLCVFLMMVSSCSSTKPVADSSSDQYLEEVESPRALEFARLENEKTFNQLQSNPAYKGIEAEVRNIVLAKDRIPWSYKMGNFYYNFWQDEKHVKGIWRRTTLNEYKKETPAWENILDIDQLASAEKENWVWKGQKCLPPLYEKCLVFLSRGGKDATTIREFDLKTKSFVEGGFFIPEAKSRASWNDENSLFVASPDSPETSTDSGYGRVLKYLERGKKLSEAPVIYEVDKKDQSVAIWKDYRLEGTHTFLEHNYSFYQRDTYLFENGVKKLIPMPKDSDYNGLFKGQLLYILKTDLKTKHAFFKAGSLVSLPLKDIDDKNLKNLKLVFSPDKKRFLEGVARTKNYLVLQVLDNIKGKLVKVSLNNKGHWAFENLKLGTTGVVSITDALYYNDEIEVYYNDFTTPYSSYTADLSAKKVVFEKLKTSPERFDPKNLVSEQKFARSKDGTMIPYFIIRAKNMKYDGKNPTLLYGYGGFEVALSPFYLNSAGKTWSEKGGVYVVANIRGGAEYGPNWHTAAVKEKHQVVFDDFIAVAEDLIKTKVTSPAHLGIQGGSNGGLLVGGTFVQRPDLFNAVICEVPLLDMLNYHRFLAGASWMDEYGNPDDPKMRDIIAKYSPLQNVKAGVKYPEVFFFTSTKDDRVHPMHARKMVAKMREQGHPLYYYENIEGGHGGAATLEQTILRTSLQMTYLWMKLK